MINRDSWGHLYCNVRGEILGFLQDKLLRKHLPKMFSLIIGVRFGRRLTVDLELARTGGRCLDGVQVRLLPTSPNDARE